MDIVITAGDCNGVGLEVLCKALANNTFPGVNLTLCCNVRTLAEYIRAMNLPVEITDATVSIGRTTCAILPCPTFAPVQFGKMMREAGALALEQLETAIAGLRVGRFDALVTMPIAKKSLDYAGWKFPGQTELLAERCGGTPLMMLMSGSLRVALATIHAPLEAVPKLITRESVSEKIQSLHSALTTDFLIRRPRIAVLGLNPHAGESGSIGTEEITEIAPAVEDCRGAGIAVEGPFPADGFFAFGDYVRFEGIMAMYHDQGLIPLKLLAKGGGVNVTSGLQVVRTSPDHGTAFGIAGRGIADPTSAAESIQTAIGIVSARISQA